MRILSLFTIVLVVYLFSLTSCLTGSSGIPSVTPQQQMTLDTTAIDKYLKNNSISYYKDASGLRFVIDSLGSGFPPRLDNEVKVTYTGKLLPSGSVFATNSADGVLSTYIAGWQVGISLLPKGSKADLYIPSGLAYGEQSDPLIPANSNLIYHVNLTDVVTTPTEQSQLVSDVAAIDAYLANNQIVAVKDTTGLRYVIHTTGSGAIPSWLSKVTLTYTGKELSTGNVFFMGTVGPSPGFDSREVNYIRAFQVGLQKMQKGATATFYVPSGLAFGSLGATSGTIVIPANTNVIFEMQLVDVSNAN